MLKNMFLPVYDPFYSIILNKISENITISGASMSVLRAVESKSGTKFASCVNKISENITYVLH